MGEVQDEYCVTWKECSIKKVQHKNKVQYDENIVTE